MTPEGFTRILRENLSYRLPEGLDRAEIPTLVIAGEREPRVMKESAQEVVRSLPDAAGRVAARQGHNWPLVSPALFASTLRAWLEERALPSELRPL